MCVQVFRYSLLSTVQSCLSWMRMRRYRIQSNGIYKEVWKLCKHIGLSLLHIVLLVPPPFNLALTALCSTAALLCELGGRKRRKEEGSFKCQLRKSSKPKVKREAPKEVHALF